MIAVLERYRRVKEEFLQSNESLDQLKNHLPDKHKNIINRKVHEHVFLHKAFVGYLDICFSKLDDIVKQLSLELAI